MIATENNEIFQSYSDNIMEADNFYSHNSVSDIITAHPKMLLSFESIIPNMRFPGEKNMWIVNGHFP